MVSGRKVRIINENFREGFGMEGVIAGKIGNKYLIRYEDEGEEFQWVMAREDFEEIQ